MANDGDVVEKDFGATCHLKDMTGKAKRRAVRLCLYPLDILLAGPLKLIGRVTGSRFKARSKCGNTVVHRPQLSTSQGAAVKTVCLDAEWKCQWRHGRIARHGRSGGLREMNLLYVPDRTGVRAI